MLACAVCQATDLLPQQPLPTGTKENTFRRNRATLCGGDILLQQKAAVSMDTALLAGSTSEAGGSLCMYGNATMSVVGSSIMDARATKKVGGCISVEGSATLNMTSTVLSGCNSTKCGGGVSVIQEGRLELVNSTLRHTTGDLGGSLCVSGSGRASVLASKLIGGRSTGGSGGCVRAEGKAWLQVVDSVVSGCRTPWGGGGIGMADQSRLELLNSTVSNNTAGIRGAIDIITNAHGGGVALWDTASLLLESSELFGNYAHYAGGGLYLSDDSTASFKGNKQSVIRNNTAGTTGGGVRLASGLAHETLSQFIKVDGNMAPNRPNISTVATTIQILSSNADNLVASDSREGFLQLTLKVLGRNDVPSDDDLVYSVYDSNHAKLFDQPVFPQGTELKTVAISLKRPPGWRDSLSGVMWCDE